MGRTGKSIIVTLALCGSLLTATGPGQTKGHTTRKAVEKAAPVYPDAARRNRIRGTVRLAVSVRANGRVMSTKVLGGNPVLAEAAMNAVRKWRFEPSPEETDEVIEIVFDPDI
jgi:TonB family protein